MYTIGHGTRPAAEFTGLLAANGIEQLCDVRAFPRSRHNPQFDKDELAQTLHAADIAYSWEHALGGRRRSTPGSPHTSLRHPAFRAYADFMSTAEFWSALDALLAGSPHETTAIMCSESLWWKCHRRLVADALTLVRAVPVAHIMPSGALAPHRPTPGVRVAGDRLVYDRPAAETAN